MIKTSTYKLLVDLLTYNSKAYFFGVIGICFGATAFLFVLVYPNYILRSIFLFAALLAVIPASYYIFKSMKVLKIIKEMDDEQNTMEAESI